MPTPTSSPDTLDTDVVVVGAGAGGLSTAVTAAYHGLRVVVLERSAVCGGATAWSGGWMWAPGNPLARADGVDEDVELVRLEDAVGRAAGVVAAAFVVEDRHLLGRAFAPAHADLQRMRQRVARELAHLWQPGDVDDFLVRHQDLMAAAIERRTGLDNNIARSAVR